MFRLLKNQSIGSSDTGDRLMKLVFHFTHFYFSIEYKDAVKKNIGIFLFITGNSLTAGGRYPTIAWEIVNSIGAKHIGSVPPRTLRLGALPANDCALLWRLFSLVHYSNCFGIRLNRHERIFVCNDRL